MPYTKSLHLYRTILREVRTLEPIPLRRKITRNTRDVFRHYRVAEGHLVQDLHKDGRALIAVVQWLRKLPEVGRDSHHEHTGEQPR